MLLKVVLGKADNVGLPRTHCFAGRQIKVSLGSSLEQATATHFCNLPSPCL